MNNITQLRLKNFSKFDDLTIDFSPRVNIIIGENGTGKTQVLKVINTLCASQVDSRTGPVTVQDSLTLGLIESFGPIKAEIGRLVANEGSNDEAVISISFEGAQILEASFSRKSSDVKAVSIPEPPYNLAPVFIPTKEIMSMFFGIKCADSDAGTVNRIFDKTYRDIADKLQVNQLDPANTFTKNPRYLTVKDLLDNAIGGEYLLGNEGFVFRQFDDDVEYVVDIASQSQISANMTAEGIRKLGTIQRLNSNGMLGGNGPVVLLWDEPETNLNPSLMRTLVEVFLELSRNGVQVILATHDYVLLKWFDLQKNLGKDDHVRFHSLYNNPKTGKVDVHSTNNYFEVEPNAIDDAFAELADREIEIEMGGLGK